MFKTVKGWLVSAKDAVVEFGGKCKDKALAWAAGGAAIVTSLSVPKPAQAAGLDLTPLTTGIDLSGVPTVLMAAAGLLITVYVAKLGISMVIAFFKRGG